MGETIPGGRYLGTDGKYHDAQGNRLHAPKVKKAVKKKAPAKKEE